MTAIPHLPTPLHLGSVFIQGIEFLVTETPIRPKEQP